MNNKIHISKEPTRIQTAVDVVIFNHKNQILLGKRLAKAGYGTWGFPGGHLIKREKIKECALREIQEELGKDISIDLTDTILAVRENLIPPYFRHHLTVVIKASCIKGKIRVKEPKRCKKWEFFYLDKLPNPLFSGVEEILTNYKQGKSLVVTDWK